MKGAYCYYSQVSFCKLKPTSSSDVINSIFCDKNVLPTQPGSCSTENAQMYRVFFLESRKTLVPIEKKNAALTNDGNIEIMLATMNNSRTTLFIFPDILCHFIDNIRYSQCSIELLSFDLKWHISV